MGQLVDQLGNKAAGQLIKSQDWNQLVAAIEAVESRLGEQITVLDNTLRQELSQITVQLSGLTTEFNAFRTAVQPILSRYYSVTLQTQQNHFAIGELAEITARVTDLDGNIPAERPWIDFVTAWGQLKPARGFLSLGGAGDRTISVQVNEQGIARVLLRAEHTEGFTDDDENEVAAALTTRLQVNNRSISEIFLQASTPMEAEVKGAFQVLSKEYDRRDALSVRSYVDTYYLKNPTLVTGKLAPGLGDRIRTRWRDYRATVMAFAKSDSNPVTADQSSGVCSIQVNFRDWISPWIVLDYFDSGTIGTLAGTLKGQLQPKITLDYKQSASLLRKEVDDQVRSLGLLGKLQRYQGINQALSQVTGNQPFLNVLTASLQSAVNIQQTLESSQLGTVGTVGEAIAFNVFTDAAIRADTNVAGVTSDITGLQQQLGQTQQQVNAFNTAFNTQFAGLQTKVNQLNGSLTTLQTQTGNFRQEIDLVKGQVQKFQSLDPAKLVTTDTVKSTVNSALIDNNLLKNLRLGDRQ